jgi:hypothetical protein
MRQTLPALAVQILLWYIIVSTMLTYVLNASFVDIRVHLALLGIASWISVTQRSFTIPAAELAALGAMLGLSLVLQSTDCAKWTLNAGLCFVIFRSLGTSISRQMEIFLWCFVFALVTWIYISQRAIFAAQLRINPNTDANTASMWFLLLALLAFRAGYSRWLFLPVAMALIFLFASRSTALFLVIFGSIFALERSRVALVWITRVKPFIIMLVVAISAHVFQIYLSDVMITDSARYDFSDDSEERGVRRTAVVTNASALARFQLSGQIAAEWRSSWGSFFLGLRHSNETWSKSYEDVIHDSYFFIMIQSGVVFGLCYFYILSRIFERFWTVENLKFLLPYLCVAPVTLGLFFGDLLLLLLIVLVLRPSVGRASSRRGRRDRAPILCA